MEMLSKRGVRVWERIYWRRVLDWLLIVLVIWATAIFLWSVFLDAPEAPGSSWVRLEDGTSVMCVTFEWGIDCDWSHRSVRE